MSEMLGNQYFMTRNYARAIEQLEKVLEEEQNNMNCRKKLVISHLQMGNYDQALRYFKEITDIDPFIIINTQPEKDGYPCPEIVDQIKRRQNSDHNAQIYFNQLAMLSLYCDVRQSIQYFKKSLRFLPDQPEIQSILKKISAITSRKTKQKADRQE